MAYDRTSVDEPNKISNEAQWQLIQEKVKSDGMGNTQRFSDVGKSGGNENREGYIALKETIQSSNQARKLYVWKLDRLARHMVTLLEFFDLCAEHQVEIISLSEPIPPYMNKAMNKLYIQLLSMQAELVRNQIKENVRLGLKEKRRKGEPLSSKLPYGYKWQKKQIKQVPEEAEIVKRMFHLYESGQVGYHKLIKQLTKEELFYHGNIFQLYHIQNILTNPMYKGEIKGGHLGSYQGNFIPIISPKQYDRVQAIRQSRRVQKKNQRIYPLRQKIVCPHCGRRLSPKVANINKVTERHTYYCSKLSCKGVILEAIAIEQEVESVLTQFIQKDDIYQSLMSSIKQSLEQLSKTNQKEAKRLENQKKYYFDQFEQGEIDIGTFKQSIQQIQLPKAYPSIQQVEEQFRQLLALPTKELADIIFNEVERIELNLNQTIKELYLHGIEHSIYHDKESRHLYPSIDSGTSR